MKRNSTVTLGIDLGDRFSEVCVLSRSGEVIERCRLKTDRGELQSWLKRPKAHVVMEVGTHSPWVSALAKELRHKVTVVNPRAFKLISGSRKKNDVEDAEMLARAARADLKLLQPVKHRDQETRADLAVLETRELLIAERTKLTNRIAGVLKSHGVRVSSQRSAAFEQSCRERMPAHLSPALEPLIELLRAVAEQVAACDKTIVGLEKRYSVETAVIRQVPRVGRLTALAFVLVIGDPKRFEESRKVGAYLGLVPAQRKSGEREAQLGITKAGHPMLRRLLVQVVHQMMRAKAVDCDLKRWALRKAHHGGKIGKKKAVVGAARKLSVLLHRLWLTGEEYEPLRAITATKK